jgi:aminoglycoside phosphotransferase (APT) family kinase protein
VLKLYRSPTGPQQATTEVAALQLLATGSVPVPGLVRSGELAGVPYVLMTRLPGVRWADRRAALPTRWSRPLHRDVGRWLRRLHAVSPAGLPTGLGSLLPGGPWWLTAGAAAEARGTDLIERYHQLGRPAEVAHGVRRLLEQHASALDGSGPPVLCHNDWVDSNLLVEPTGEPRPLGVVDLERASWGDPMADLAQTWRHAAFHDQAAATELVEAYGVGDEAERNRMAVHVVLHTLAELIWICTDRPQGWQRSVAELEHQLRTVELG